MMRFSDLVPTTISKIFEYLLDTRPLAYTSKKVYALYLSRRTKLNAEFDIVVGTIESVELLNRFWMYSELYNRLSEYESCDNIFLKGVEHGIFIQELYIPYLNCRGMQIAAKYLQIDMMNLFRDKCLIFKDLSSLDGYELCGYAAAGRYDQFVQKWTVMFPGNTITGWVRVSILKNIGRSNNRKLIDFAMNSNPLFTIHDLNLSLVLGGNMEMLLKYNPHPKEFILTGHKRLLCYNAGRSLNMDMINFVIDKFKGEAHSFRTMYLPNLICGVCSAGSITIVKMLFGMFDDLTVTREKKRTPLRFSHHVSNIIFTYINDITDNAKCIVVAIINGHYELSRWLIDIALKSDLIQTKDEVNNRTIRGKSYIVSLIDRKLSE
jgi:hypothetical protein